MCCINTVDTDKFRYSYILETVTMAGYDFFLTFNNILLVLNFLICKSTIGNMGNKYLALNSCVPITTSHHIQTG